MNAHTIVTITPTHVIAQEIELKAATKVISQKEVEWKKGELAQAIGAVIEAIPKTQKIRIILTESLYYLVGFSVEKKFATEREYIRRKASEFLVEDLASVRWDYVVAKSDDNLADIQVVCLTQDIDIEFSQLSENLDIYIEAVVPDPLILLESIKERDATFILIYADTFIRSISVIKDGLVLFSTGFENSKVLGKFLETVRYVENHLQLTTNIVVECGLAENELLELKKEYKVVSAQIDPAILFAELRHFNGADEKVLSIEVNQGTVLGGLEEIKKNQKAFLGIIFFVALAGIIFGIVVAGNLF